MLIRPLRFRAISSTLRGTIDELLDEAGQVSALAQLDREMQFGFKKTRLVFDEQNRPAAERLENETVGHVRRLVELSQKAAGAA
jgi:hypothetical protein